MIPIVTISGIFLFILLLIGTIKIYFSYRKTKGKILGYFLKSFLCFCIGALIFIPNGILVKDLKIINLIFNIYTFFFFLGSAYFVALTFEILHREDLRKIFFKIIVIFGFILSFVSAISWQSATMTIQEPFIFWEDTRGPIINILTGAGLGILVLWNIGFFVYNAIKSDDKYVRMRSFFLSGGMLCFLIASITDYIFGVNPNIFYISLYTSFWDFLAIIFLLLAIYYKKPKESFTEDKI